MLLSRRTRFMTGFAGGLLAAVLFLTPLAASALPYGGGNYGGCKYGQNCGNPTPGGDTGKPTPTTSSPGTTTDDSAEQPADPTGQNILLNDFQEYATESGKTLNVVVNQVVYFNIQTADGLEKHSVTIKEIGADYVVLIIASEPQTVRLNVGQTGQYDVTDDGQNDIAITLNSITNQKANLTFRQLTKAPVTTTGSTATEPSATPAKNSRWTLILSIAALVLAVIIFIWLAARRKKRDNVQF